MTKGIGFLIEKGATALKGSGSVLKKPMQIKRQVSSMEMDKGGGGDKGHQHAFKMQQRQSVEKGLEQFGKLANLNRTNLFKKNEEIEKKFARHYSSNLKPEDEKADTVAFAEKHSMKIMSDQELSQMIANPKDYLLSFYQSPVRLENKLHTAELRRQSDITRLDKDEHDDDRAFWAYNPDKHFFTVFWAQIAFTA